MIFDERYVTPDELEKKGFCKTARGLYRRSALERCAAAGWLGSGAALIERLSAGKRLYADFYLGGVESVGAADLARIRVDGSGSFKEPDRRLWHQARYQQAIAQIPHEFWPAVRRVCIEDKNLLAAGETDWERRMSLAAQRLDLRRGLDRLCAFRHKKMVNKG